VDLFPLDSVESMHRRGVPGKGEMGPSEVSRVLAESGRTTMGWVRVDPPLSTYSRKWSIFWAKRSWVLRGEMFRASASGIVAQHFQIELDVPVGFVGTTSADLHPVSSQEAMLATGALVRGAANRIVSFFSSGMKK
jgi:hypothetical protein